ncbi:GlcNAc-PI de-N-acetylase [Leptolinea sp. HRD-7]|jgi:LmbE family N-acetylglucosaminyl deacetylase|nr:GlcNAc-PI de-N-acetylase [Leptolinea sp. HRD-7]
MSTKRTILAVLAHPDDESFGTGGTLALYASRGVDVYLVCATRGEVGEMPPDMMAGFNTVGEKRESELRCAGNILGLKSIFFLGYRDSGMPGTPDNNHPQALAAQPVETVAEEVARYIRKLKPAVVITFDPIGGYFHPDHIAIHKATVRGFELAGDESFVCDGLEPFRPAKLYYQTISRGFLRFAVMMWRLLGRDPRKFGANRDIDMAAIAEVDFPITTRIHFREVAKIREAASACHASQGGTSLASGVVGWFRRMFDSTEVYMRAIPPAEPGEKETDLFAGID